MFKRIANHLFIIAILCTIFVSCQNEDCVIVYTTEDNQPIQLRDNVTFGANLKRHVYEGGQGRIVFDAPVTEVGKHAFEENDKLTFVKLPQTVIKIDTFAFFDCAALKRCDIPPHCQYIGVGAFAGCENYLYEEVVLPNSVSYIGARAFYGCKFVKFVLPASLKKLKMVPFCMLLPMLLFCPKT